MENQKIDKPVSMFVMFARFFSIVAKHLEQKYGQEGLDLLADCVKEWGFKRGQDIAARAKAQGKDNTLDQYLCNYDMERSELFGYTTDYGKEEIHQEFTRCVFAQTWMDADEEKYGRIYCENIDPAIASGYNENLQCIHDQIMYKDKHCNFCFKMKK